MEGKQGSADDWRAEGDAHFDARRWQEAAHAYERALALEPGCVESWYKLGNAQQEQGHELRAIECFEKVLALEPDHAKAWNNVGVSRQKLGQEALAAEAYRRAIERDPALVQAVLNLAHLNLRLGDDEGAVTLLERATLLDRSNADTWNALARARLRLGRTAAANEAYRIAVEILWPRVEPHTREAELALARGDYAAAEASLAAALEYLPEHAVLRHMFAAVRGETIDRASREYISTVFDSYAENFDRTLRSDLGYRVPEQLAEVITPMLQRAHPVQVVDLGCGTGLLGTALSHLGANIVGIDLSAKMLERAAKREAYAQLIKGDIVEELARMPAATMDAVVAADVFAYVGDLQPLFTAAARVLVSGGVFAFSVEALDRGNFQIRPTGRFAHSAGYLRDLAAESRLTESRMQRIPGRRERDGFIEFWLACFVAADQ